VCGFIAVGFRHASVKTLIVLSVVFTSAVIIFNVIFGLAMPYIPPEGMTEIIQAWKPSAEQLQIDLDGFSGNWWQQFITNAPTAALMQTFLLLFFSLWRVLGMMLLGIALYKLGIITAQKSTTFYWRMVLLCTSVGLAIILAGVNQNQLHDFDIAYSMYFGSLFNYVGSVLMALAYVAVVMLMMRLQCLLRLQAAFAALGKTAFTNYILQSLICTFFFYGFGLGFYGDLVRYELVLFTVCVWIIQLSLASLWLKYFEFGPLEWLWRCLTYKHWSPISKN